MENRTANKDSNSGSTPSGQKSNEQIKKEAQEQLKAMQNNQQKEETQEERAKKRKNRPPIPPPEKKPRPVTEKETDEVENDVMQVVACQMQGWRDAQEDAHITDLDIDPDIHLFCVFDGHGGQCISRYCKENFKNELRATQAYKDADYPKALEQTCLKMDADMGLPEGLEDIYYYHGGTDDIDWSKVDEATLKAKRPDAGCTANICLFVKNKIYCANVGDSRTVVNENGRPHDLSEDHKPTLRREEERIKKAGGFIIQGRVNFKLALTRAIGDFLSKQNKARKPEEQILIAVPDIEEYEWDKEKNPYIIMGCDGIWDEDGSSQININRVNKAIEKNKSIKDIIHQDIMDTILSKEENAAIGTDNMTCIIIKFK